MRKLLLLSALILFVNTVFGQQTNFYYRNAKPTGICYAGNKVTRIYIPPPDEFTRKRKAAGGASVTIYYNGFSTDAKNALEYAASILESVLPADTKLTIVAFWEKISTSGVLGQSTITGYAGGWGIDALNPTAVYPVSLAEKIAGKSLNTDLEGDLQLTINSSQPWYLGTDGKTPSGKFDLVTVALHEICHGLGFYDSFDSDGTLGWYGFGSQPLIYDTFVESNAGSRLTDTLKFRNFSPQLKTQLTGDNLWFNGPLLKNYCTVNNISPLRARLWAPFTWDAGSSVSHLDENRTLQVNSLMTPSIDYGEAIHNPGKYTLSILSDLGWVNTRIVHKQPKDTEQHITELPLSVTIKSDTLYNHDKVGFVYSFDNFATSDTLFMVAQNSGNTYNTLISIPGYNTELQYYFFTEDCFLRLYRSPSLYNKIRYTTFVGKDTIKPSISHTPAKYFMESVDTIEFAATARDNIAIDTVYIEYRVNDGPSSWLGMKAGADDSYLAKLNARLLNLNGGDSVHYRIFAVDSAFVPNTAVLPEKGFFSVKVEEILTPVKSYSTDFTNAAPDFFNIGFDVSRPSGFINFGLNTKHPYESPEVDGGSIEYTAMLRHPLILDESGLLINFSEIVLVEPGEDGSVFGSPDFYDYVIVEASRDNGKSWISLADGYDSRYNSVWDSAYNSSIIDGNSTFVPTESLLRKHTFFIRPSGKFAPGDNLLLRFRLFSDPYAYGWGWIIEDLKINPLIDAVEKVNGDSVVVYPNPGRGLIRITSSGGYDNSVPFRYSIFNSAGTCLVDRRLHDGSGILADISDYPSGLYIIVLYRSDGVKTIRYSLIK